MSESESKRTPRKRGSRAQRAQNVGRGEGTAAEGTAAGQEVGGGQTLAGDRPAPERRDVPDTEIQRRAYELYLQRGGAPGAALDDWLAAEDELRGKRGNGTGG
ncbi:MAG TPA: DUF2934 domain-containing protein [Gemmatimonadaceae bacterium]|nr:DUF2934 domain-containing protein [Gemmatimonadaceae bacterium]